MSQQINDIIKRLDLKPHPEGGFYKETYRSKGLAEITNLNPSYKGIRNYATCIYFLLTSETFSAFHKIKQDEIWHFYDGTTIELHSISESGMHSKFLIGKNFSNNETPQLVVPGNHWFAAKVIACNSFALVGCTVSPGFSFEDFKLGKRQHLIEKFPEHEDLITCFTNP